MEFTEKQQLAIDIRDANVLVSAAAGSGKTSVLVERIVRRISGEGVYDDKPVDIDRLLVMTFTNAAAAEMRERIRDAIDKRMEDLRKIPAGERNEERLLHLTKQSLLVHNAMITTIHGFCRSVITDHFGEVALDPDFRVADEEECSLIMQEALDECMEAAYEKGDPGFLKAVECFCTAKNDRGLADLVIPVYRFIIADPDPGGFIKRCCRSYEYENYEEFENSDIMRLFDMILAREIGRGSAAVEAAVRILDDHKDLEPYRPHIEAFRQAFSEAGAHMLSEDARDNDILRSILSFEIPRLASVRSAGLDDDTKAKASEFKGLRDLAKEEIGRISHLLSLTGKEEFEKTRPVLTTLKAVSDLVLDFKRIYEEKKRDANIIDFNDMEHMAVAILQNPDTAAVYREHFVEIYVDEYQDSNMIQEMLVSLVCRHDPGNVFCVGDVKQSIYRFRQARPDLFLSKYNTYTDEKGPDQRILLNDNFRSRREVVDSVNEVFSHIMKADMGGIEYDEAARLAYGAHYYEDMPQPDMDYRTEIIIGDTAADEAVVEDAGDQEREPLFNEKLSKEEFAANIVADRITSMIRSHFTIYDKEKKTVRPVSFRDFTILVRSVKSFEPVFRKVFAGAGIPLAVKGREGYFGTVEVQTALAFLQAVDNPLCDIPLATLAASPVGGFTSEDLASVTAGSDTGMCLFDRISSAAQNSPETEEDDAHRSGLMTEGKEDDQAANVQVKCKNFISLLAKYKSMSAYTTVYGILSDFIDNEYGDYVRCMDRNEQRMANLSMLLAKAEAFGRTSFKGLYQFVRYMDQIRKYEIDDGEAATATENEDVVRLMTMHASKGLEFPVCILAGLEKRRNTGDESGSFLCSTSYGFGVGYTDPDRRIKSPTLPGEMIAEANRTEAVAEEMRLLYVAMTRARDKLIMIGCPGSDCFDGGPKSIDRSMNFLDMIRAAHGEEGFDHIDITYVKLSDLVAARFEHEVGKEALADELMAVVREHLRGAKRDDTDGKMKLPAYLIYADHGYPFELHPELRAKLSVSDLKHKAIEEKIEQGMELVPDGEQLFAETEPEKYIPKFMRAGGQTERGGTFYGTAFHRIMELWDYSNVHVHEGDPTTSHEGHDENAEITGVPVTPEDVLAFAGRMQNLHRMSKEQVDAIRADDVAYFLNSALGIQMRHAAKNNMLFREQPFVIGIPEAGETILVQGIIDAFFMEEDGITILDYKTDRVADEQMLVNRYRTQLEYYKMALSRITGKPVKALVIYSTRLRASILL